MDSSVLSKKLCILLFLCLCSWFSLHLDQKMLPFLHDVMPSQVLTTAGTNLPEMYAILAVSLPEGCKVLAGLPAKLHCCFASGQPLVNDTWIISKGMIGQGRFSGWFHKLWFCHSTKIYCSFKMPIKLSSDSSPVHSDDRYASAI